MTRVFLLCFILISSLTIINGYYNPIPVGCVIISTKANVMFLQPREYGGADQLTTIFKAANGTTIVYTIYDPTPRNLYILYSNQTGNGKIYLSQLIARDQLSSTVYELPISTNISYINKLISFTADVTNNRAFLTDENGNIIMFSTSGLMKAMINNSSNITMKIRSVVYNNKLNRLFIITNSTLYSCANLETNNLQCCQGLSSPLALRSITFDPTSSDSYVYVIDGQTGVYQMALNAAGCPEYPGPISSLQGFTYIQLVVDGNVFFYSGSVSTSDDNSYLIIGNTSQHTRKISIGASIVALHISYRNTGTTISTTETCFNGITYSDYRLAVVLAAIFGTIMGIFMCFNALFCIDFFMTKRIIRNLKQQIPHNLLEDRWNKLVEEKYAKLALEMARKNEDALPALKRKSSAAARRTPPVANVGGNDSSQANGTNAGETLQVPGAIPKLTAYLRRKSDSMYVNRRRSDDYRTQRQTNNNEITTARPQVHIESVQEENEARKGLRQNLSRRELLKNDEDFL